MGKGGRSLSQNADQKFGDTSWENILIKWPNGLEWVVVAMNGVCENRLSERM